MRGRCGCRTRQCVPRGRMLCAVSSAGRRRGVRTGAWLPLLSRCGRDHLAGRGQGDPALAHQVVEGGGLELLLVGAMSVGMKLVSTAIGSSLAKRVRSMWTMSVPSVILRTSAS